MNLRERALFAHHDRVAADTSALACEAIKAVQEIVGDSDDIEIADVDNAVRPYMAPPFALVDVDGLRFKVTISTSEKRAAKDHSNSGMVWDEVTVKVGLMRPGGSDIPVACLADIGRAFSDAEVAAITADPDDAPETLPPADAPAQNFGLKRFPDALPCQLPETAD